MNQFNSRRAYHYNIAALLLVVLFVALVFGQVVGHQFVAWDDTSYVSENRQVLQGLHWGNVVWSFSTFQLSNWHPLTLLSHMADISLWGLRPGLHAMVNVALHAINSMLVYLLLCRFDLSTNVRSRPHLLALLVALLFATHPLHVESVAWISERKDVLCAFFWLLATHAYLGYARQPTAMAYARVTLCLALALLAKPMAITLPLVFLILDWWVLQRRVVWGDVKTRLAVNEKLPWLAMAGLVGVLTLLAQTQAMPAFAPVDRLRVAVAAYGWYLEKTIWPSGLHFYYLTESAWSPIRLAISTMILLAISALVIRERHRHPDWIAGWLWFLVTLLPVVGFVKVGTQAWADRYAYLPHIGLFWMLVSMGAALLVNRQRRQVGAVVAIMITVALAWGSARQVAVWRDTNSLYRHALEQNAGHYVAIMGLANQALRDKDYTAAKGFANRALELSNGPALVRSMQSVLGDVALATGDPAAALSHYSIGSNADLLDDGIRVKLGLLLLNTGRLAEAEGAFRAALTRAADSVDALNGLGVVLGLRGSMTESYAVLQRGIALAPEHRGLRHNLATTALRAGNIEMARHSYRELLARFPDDAIALKALAAPSENK